MTQDDCHDSATMSLHNGPLTFTARTKGSGPVVVLLHGFPDTLDTWEAQLSAVADAGYRAIAVALRGYEPSSIPADGDFSMEAIAGDVIAWLDELGVDRVHLVGHDWGASIAYSAAALAPNRFKSLCTLAVPHAGRFLTEVHRHPKQLKLSWYMGFFQLRGIADAYFARRDYAFISTLWRSWSPGWQFSKEELERVVAVFRAPGVAWAALGYYRAALGWSALPLTRASRNDAMFPVAVPTLGITGRDEGCIDSEVFSAMMYEEDFPQGLDVEIVENAGHFAHREQPEAVNQLLLRHIQRWD